MINDLPIIFLRTGSIERLDETGHFRRIITSHQTAEDNINVVIRYY